MLPRVRPFFNNNFFKVIKQFDFNLERNEFYKNVSNNIIKYYPRAKSLDYTDYGRNSLFLILKILNIKKNDEILIPAFTCSVILDAILGNEIKPILYDINFDFTIDRAQLQNKITQNTKAILITHYWGIPSNIMEIREIADAYGIYLIEDCAHSFGFKYNNIPLGSIGDLSFTSMGNDKPISLGNGSILVNNNDDLSKNFFDIVTNIPLNDIENEKCSFLSLLFFYLMTDRNHYTEFIGVEDFYNFFIAHKSKRDLIFQQIDDQEMDVNDFFKFVPHIENKKPFFKHLRIIKDVIYSYKRKSDPQFSKPIPKLMNSFSLNILEVAVNHIDELNSIRTNNGLIYTNSLQKNELFYSPLNPKNVPFLRYSIICKKPKVTPQIVKRLNSNGYECSNFNWGVPLNKLLKSKESYKNSEYLSKNIINLPCYPNINREDILKICDILNNFN